MRRSICITVVLLVAGAGPWMSACTDFTPHQTNQSSHIGVARTDTPGPKVVILVIDGLRYTEGFGDSTSQHIPYMSGTLRPLGTLFDNFRNTGDTRTVPGHAAMVTGTWQYLANDGSERPDVPTMFEYYRKTYSLASGETWLISGKPKLAACSYGTHADYGPAYGASEAVGLGEDPGVYSRLIDVLATDHPSLVLANFASVDWAGHSGVWEQYTDAIEVADSLAAEVWQYLQSDTVYAGRTYLFVTNDHGRHSDNNGGFSNHGDACEGCQHVMLLALGPDVRVGYTVANFYTLRDLCPTVGEILGFDTPHSVGTDLTEMYIPSLTGIESD